MNPPSRCCSAVAYRGLRGQNVPEVVGGWVGGKEEDENKGKERDEAALRRRRRQGRTCTLL